MTGPNLASTRAQTRVQTAACSFDVFDTFLLRACTTSDGVFERAFQLSPVRLTHPKAITSYVQHRIQAEARARVFAREKTGTFEIGIKDIYACFPFRLFDLDRTALQDLADAEFRAELDLCLVNDEMLRLYQDARKQGRRTGFISDTYWNERQLATLLRHCQPGLEWDFLYASCEHGTGKSGDLFARYLAGQDVDPSTALHIGDNPKADIGGARQHGIRPRFYPQASARLAAQFQRESATFDLLCADDTSRLDLGSRTLRRMVVAQTPEKFTAFQLGVATIGPVMAAFDRFIEQQVARLRQNGAKVAVAFLGRDGFLPYRVWRDMREDPASYIEINRRVSLIGSATTVEPIVNLLRKFAAIDAITFSEILKVLPASVADFFNRLPGGRATGKQIAEAFPRLIDESQITGIAAAMRTSMLAYLRHRIADFDDCTDLVLVDLGYSGSVQKAMRRIFDSEGINIRLHGTYLLPLDDAFDGLAADDTVGGFISDLVVTPHIKRMLIRNVALLEQICCSGDGSVRDYLDGEVLREINLLPPEQLALTAEIQSGALAFINRAQEFAPRYRLQPYAAMDVAAKWTTAILGRLLLLPDDDELVMLGSLKHDVNLGTQSLAPMLDADAVRNLEFARGLLPAHAAPAPPMWLAGSFAALSPSHSYLYMLFGANRLPSDVVSDAKCGDLQIGLFSADGSASMETVSFYRSGMGDVRIQIPISSEMAVRTIAVPVAKIVPEGILRGVTAQAGATVRKAAQNPEIFRLPDSRLAAAGIERSGRYYRANDQDGCLLITVEETSHPVTIFSVTLTSLADHRMLAAHGGGGDEDISVALLGDSPRPPQP